MKVATVNREATALLAHPKVATLIARLRADMVAAHEVTRERITAELAEDRTFAREKGAAAAAITATATKAKLHGLMKEEAKPVAEVTFVFNLTGDRPEASGK